MAETSGFFQAMWDENAVNPETGEDTGYWDRTYIASQFAKYFSLFVGNGVFESPTNQLKVIAGTGNTVVVTEGFAFINGNWYHNDENLVLTIPANSTPNNRVDSVRLRFSDVDREIKAIVIVGDIEPVRGDTIYDLILAEVIVAPSSVQIVNSNISDKRPDETVCGFVKGVLEVETTKDLFLQYEAIFNEWFDTVKDQVKGDLAIRLQTEFEQINADIKNYKDDVAAYYEQIGIDNEKYKNDLQNIVNESKKIVETFVDSDFVIPKASYTFTSNQCRINNDKVTANTLVDVYFDEESIQEAIRCSIFVNSYDGYILLKAERQPSKALTAVIRVRVR